MTNKKPTEQEREETLNTQILCEKLQASYEELNKRAEELEQQAKVLREMASISLYASSSLWSKQYNKVNGNEIKDFWSWVFNDKKWDKHRDKYNFRFLETKKENRADRGI